MRQEKTAQKLSAAKADAKLKSSNYAAVLQLKTKAEAANVKATARKAQAKRAAARADVNQAAKANAFAVSEADALNAKENAVTTGAVPKAPRAKKVAPKDDGAARARSVMAKMSAEQKREHKLKLKGLLASGGLAGTKASDALIKALLQWRFSAPKDE